MKSKKKVSGVLISVFETYTRNCWVADEEQKEKRSKEKNLVGGGNRLFYFIKGGN